MAQDQGRNRSLGWVVGIVAVVAAILIFGVLTSGFGLYSNEMTPGTTTPPNNPS